VPGRRSTCSSPPSTDPSGMGAHMVDLLAEYAATGDVALMMRPTPLGRRLHGRIGRAADGAARSGSPVRPDC
jgi:hypothetical protein